MPYTPSTWADGPSGNTPITAAQLSHVETQYSQAVAFANGAFGQDVRAWQSGTTYAAGQPVISPWTGTIVLSKTAHTSGGTYTGAGTGNWAPAAMVPLNVKEFGAKGDGTTDDTAAIQATINYAQSIVTSTPSIALGDGVLVYFSRGTYLISSTLLINTSNIILQGESSASAIITAVSPSYDLVQFKNDAATIYRSGIRTIRITATGNATAGYALRTERCTYFVADDVLFGGWYGGMIISGCGVSYYNKLIFSQEERTSGTTGTAIYLDAVPNYSADIHFTDIQVAETLATSVTSSIIVTSVDGLYITNLHLHGEVTFNPSGSGQQVTLRSVEFTNCYFDGSNGAGVNLSGAPSNAYDDIRFTNCYFRGAVSGLKVSATVAVTNVIVVGCRFHGNSADGIQLLSSSTVTDLLVNGCIFSGNNTGNIVSQGDVSIQGTATHVTIANCIFNGGGNPGVGVAVGTTPQNVVLSNLNFMGSTAQFKLSVGAGSTVFYKGILGYTVKNKGHVTLTTATTQTVTHGMNITPILEAIQLTFNGSAPACYVSNITSTTFDVVFASAPTSGVVMGWLADMEY